MFNLQFFITSVQRTWRTVIQLPSGACINPLPPILPQLIVIFEVSLSPVTVSLLSVHWPCLVNAVPGKERERRSFTRASLSHKMLKEQSGRLSNIKQKGNTSLNNPFASFSTNTNTPLPPPTHVPSPPHALPSTLPFPLLLPITHLQMKTTPNEQRRSGKQMFDLINQLSKRKGTHTIMKLYDTHKKEIHNLTPERKKGESNLNLKATLPPHWAQQLFPLWFLLFCLPNVLLTSISFCVWNTL